VSHELRTPLTAVRGFAESLADGVVTGDDVGQAGATIVAEAARLDRLVGDLMELARLEADDFRLDLLRVDLGAVAREAGTVWHARCRAAGVVFSVHAPASTVWVTADPRRLRQVVDGLAENALRVTTPGGSLAFAVFPGGALQVRDGGPGLAPEDYAVVFDRGVLHERYRGHRPVGAGGVGLALVHGLVTRMGGTSPPSPPPRAGRASPSPCRRPRHGPPRRSPTKPSDHRTNELSLTRASSASWTGERLSLVRVGSGRGGTPGGSPGGSESVTAPRSGR
jgi:signal transduction histidine kinase